MTTNFSTQSAASPLATGLPSASALPANPGLPGAASPHTTQADLSGVPAKARFILGIFKRLQYGQVLLSLPDGQRLSFGQGQPQVQVFLANYKVFDAAMSSGDIGFAQTFIEGDWDCDDLAAMLDIMVANRQSIERVVYGNWVGRLVYRFQHLMNRNSKSGSRRNIHAHYDIGNRFYDVWLDKSMTYSSALFNTLDKTPRFEDLPQAQHNKYQRILDELRLAQPIEQSAILEIGCGWGGFAKLAAQQGATVKGLTLSTEQLALAQQRLANDGLAQSTNLALQDYRDEHGTYDAIVSIEMFEAVGEAYWDSYFDVLRRCLKQNGQAVIQTITIDNSLFERYRKSTDFIQQYIFPGGMLPSPKRFEALAKSHGLEVVKGFAFGQHYAHTLRLWREQFLARIDQVKAQGFDTAFLRTWEFYLVYCEAAFRHGNTDVHQYTLRKQ
jgi:cyclopropane-fatty-acyl-phospholipid synthase